MSERDIAVTFYRPTKYRGQKTTTALTSSLISHLWSRERWEMSK